MRGGEKVCSTEPNANGCRSHSKVDGQRPRCSPSATAGLKIWVGAFVSIPNKAVKFFTGCGKGGKSVEKHNSDGGEGVWWRFGSGGVCQGGGGGLWLTEQPCLAISEVFTRAITVIIISTIPGRALSWDASAAPGIERLPASFLFFFLEGAGVSQLLVGVRVSGNTALQREVGVIGGGF